MNYRLTEAIGDLDLSQEIVVGRIVKLNFKVDRDRDPTGESM